MNNKFKIYELVVEKCKNININDFVLKKSFGIDATEISEKTNIKRSNVSAILNMLVKEKKLVKIISRPVYFINRDKLKEILGYYTDEKIYLKDLIKYAVNRGKIDESTFESVIGYNGSIKEQIEQAKAAVLYPPNGLHTLIIGPSGSGKSFLAEAMYNFRLKAGLGGNFEVFNCADYYNNPELINSYIFGHVKGSYTGADSDRIGLVEKANGGILFLDEVHRLHPESQEMLFYLLDKGLYYRLGDSNERKANIMLIAATTEEVDSFLLKSFLRRIPIIIQIPPLEKRSKQERIDILVNLFSSEAKRIKTNIIVYPSVVINLINASFEGNIGELKSIIQVLCSKAFLRRYNNDTKFLKIDFSLLDNKFKNFICKNKIDEFLIILKNGREKWIKKYDFYEIIIDQLRSINKDEDKISKIFIEDIINKYIDDLLVNLIEN
ncbi:MAG: sigma 54-interacting transcriptional regulator [Minisyncoccia bacterium]